MSSGFDTHPFPICGLPEGTSRLHDDQLLTHFSLDISEELTELDRLNREQLSEFKAETIKAKAETTQKKLELSPLRQESTSLKAQLPFLRTQLANLQKTVTQITAQLEESTAT